MLRCLVSRVGDQFGRQLFRHPCDNPILACNQPTRLLASRAYLLLKRPLLPSVGTPGNLSGCWSAAQTAAHSGPPSVSINGHQWARHFHAKGSKVRYLDFRYKFRNDYYKCHLLIIRRQKMKKHRRRKWRKKFKCLLAKKRLKREIAKEKAFRVELLTMIKRAEQFDPKEYALRKIREANEARREVSKEERLEELKELIRVNRYQVTYIKPKHKRMDTMEDYK